MNVYLFANRSDDSFDAAVTAADEGQAWNVLINRLEEIAAKYNVHISTDVLYIRGSYPSVIDPA